MYVDPLHSTRERTRLSLSLSARILVQQYLFHIHPFWSHTHTHTHTHTHITHIRWSIHTVAVTFLFASWNELRHSFTFACSLDVQIITFWSCICTKTVTNNSWTDETLAPAGSCYNIHSLIIIWLLSPNSNQRIRPQKQPTAIWTKSLSNIQLEISHIWIETSILLLLQ